jgi:activating signal cointegrator 1
MKALTLWQPWATLIAMGEKRIETRTWSTRYRGELAIHSAAKLPPKWLGASSRTDPFRDELADLFAVRRDRDDRGGKHVDDLLRTLPLGKIVCVVRLTEIEEVSDMLRETLSTRERLFGNYENGRYAWRLELTDVIEPPIPAKGQRLLWHWYPRADSHEHTGPVGQRTPNALNPESEGRDPKTLSVSPIPLGKPTEGTKQ